MPQPRSKEMENQAKESDQSCREKLVPLPTQSKPYRKDTDEPNHQSSQVCLYFLDQISPIVRFLSILIHRLTPNKRIHGWHWFLSF